METQGLREEGTLRTTHRETHAVKRKPAPRAIADKARTLVESTSQSGPIIRQRLDLDRMKPILQKATFYVAGNDGRAETGFLVFLPGQAPIFLQMRPKAPPACTLRMRVSNVLGEGGGSVFVASLDSVQHTLRLEDVWMWRGRPVFEAEPYSVRRGYLKEFVEKYWIPDARLLGGILTTIVNPMPLESGLAAPDSAHTLELFPEQAGRRRLWFELEQPAQKAGLKPDQKPGPKPDANTIYTDFTESTPTKPAVIQQGAVIQREAIAKPIENLPDIYDLFDDQGLPISRASVQRFVLSQELRSKKKEAGVRVKVEWRQDFGGYEIIQTL